MVSELQLYRPLRSNLWGGGYFGGLFKEHISHIIIWVAVIANFSFFWLKISIKKDVQTDGVSISKGAKSEVAIHCSRA